MGLNPVIFSPYLVVLTPVWTMDHLRMVLMLSLEDFGHMLYITVRPINVLAHGTPGYEIRPESNHHPEHPGRSLHRRWVIFSKSCLLKSALFFLPKISGNTVSAFEHQKKSLWSLTHGNTQQANTDLDACNDVKDFQDSTLNQPVIGSPCQAEAEDVFENQEAREGFDSNIPCYF